MKWTGEKSYPSRRCYDRTNVGERERERESRDNTKHTSAPEGVSGMDGVWQSSS